MTLSGQVACFETTLGERFGLDCAGEIFDQAGRLVGKLSGDQQRLRFEINKSSCKEPLKKLIGFVRNGEALVKSPFNMIPATMSIGRFKDLQGRLLTVQALLHLLDMSPKST